MAKDWQMPRADRVCCACGREFEPGESFRGLLYESVEGYYRRDYCAQCPPPQDETVLASWLARRPVPQEKKAAVAFDRAATYRFFQQLEDAETPAKIQLRFVLALVLWRKKVLKFERSVESAERELWEFAVVGGNDRHRVERPDLDEGQLEALGQQLQDILAGQMVPVDESADESAEEPPVDLPDEPAEAGDDTPAEESGEAQHA